MIRACPHCGARNRIPASHLARTGRCGKCRGDLPPLAEAVDVDAAQFDEIVGAAEVPVIVDFWAPWCGPCKMAGPEVAKAAANLAGRAVVLKVNTQNEQALAARYGVRSIPNFAAFNAGKLTWQQPGLLGHEQLEQLVGQGA